MAEIAYKKPPQFERYAFDQLRTYEATVEAYETYQRGPGDETQK